jgi:hypothetical protein
MDRSKYQDKYLLHLSGAQRTESIIYSLSRHRIGRIYKCQLFFQTLLEAGHTMHICAAIETGDQHYNRSYGMSCLKYDNVMALYRIYIAFSYH